MGRAPPDARVAARAARGAPGRREHAPAWRRDAACPTPQLVRCPEAGTVAASGTSVMEAHAGTLDSDGSDGPARARSLPERGDARREETMWGGGSRLGLLLTALACSAVAGSGCKRSEPARTTPHPVARAPSQPFRLTPRRTGGPTVTIFSTGKGLPSRYARALARAPDGALWVALMAERGVGVYAGVARILDDRVSSLRGPRSGLRSDQVNALAVASDGTLWAATARGLHRFAGRRFVPVGPEVSLRRLVRDPAGGVWAAGVVSFQPWVGHAARDGLVRVATSGSCREIRRLLVGAHDTVTLICADALHRGDARRGLRPVPLEKTPLYHRVRGERRMPSIYLYDGAQTRGGLYLVGHSKRLVRMRGSRFEVVARGHFARVLAGRGTDLFASDFRGRLWRFDGKRLHLLVKRGDDPGSMEPLLVDGDGALWVEVAPGRKQPHEILRFPAPYRRHRRWSLGRKGYLSPGVLDSLSDGRAGLWLSTNEGIWHLGIGRANP